MYRIVVQLQHNQIVRYQLPKFSSPLTRMAQTLSIRLIKHQVVFGGRGYAIVLKYKCPCKNYLYEVVQARGKRKMAVTRTQLELATVQFN